jgi:hypothetical protein
MDSAAGRNPRCASAVPASEPYSWLRRPVLSVASKLLAPVGGQKPDHEQDDGRSSGVAR